MKHKLREIFRIWEVLKPFHNRFYIQLGLIFVSQLFVVIFAYMNGHLLDSLVAKNIPKIELFFIVWVIISIIDNVFLDYAMNVNKEKYLDETLYSHLQEFSLRKILTLTIAQHVEDHSALKFTIISKGESATKNIIDSLVTTVLPSTILILLSVCTLFYYNATIGIISVFAIGIVFCFSLYSNKRWHPLIMKNRDNWNQQNKIRMEAFSHLQLVKILNREESFIAKYLMSRLAIVKYHLSVRITRARIGATRSFLTETGSWITLGFAALFFINGAYPIGTIYIIWSLSTRVYWQVSSLSNAMRGLPIYYADAEKYFQIIDLDPVFREKGQVLKQLSGNIVFSHVTFAYPHGTNSVFENISFTVPEGKTTAFVGTSGSGKSTIVRLLLRAYDYPFGSITIGGNELKSIDAGSIRERIGYVEQHVDLFDDTIRENIIIGVPEDKRKEAEGNLEEIASRTRITEFYHRLGEKRFDTVVGERGIKLSGGERQRIGIARAVIKNPDILIFDEATSSLDTENEKFVMEAIREVSQGKTTLIIAHRLSTIVNADKIVVMDKGRIIAEGSHNELMSQSPDYRNLIENQIIEV